LVSWRGRWVATPFNSEFDDLPGKGLEI